MAKHLFSTRATLIRRMQSTKRDISKVDGANGIANKENNKKPAPSPARQSSLLSMWGGKTTSTDKANPVASSAVAKTPTMSKSDFEKELTDEQKTLLKLELDTLNGEWLRVLKPELTKPTFIKVCQRVS